RDSGNEVMPQRSHRWLILAGGGAGLATPAKPERVLAAVSAGVVGVALASYPSVKRAAVLGSLFVSPVAVLVLGTYGFIAGRVGWHTLIDDSLLFLRHLPPELVYFNKR